MASEAEQNKGEDLNTGERNDAKAKQVLGSLPHHRPSIETPRRASARASAEKASAAPPDEPRSGAPHSELQELEQLARTGVRLAGGAAATGLKLAGRAVGGLGRVVGRR